MITVWRIPLDPGSAPAPGALAELAPGERERAARFRADPLRNRWLHAHVALRRILARELAVAPSTLLYESGAEGKPRLATPTGARLEFNLSDSADLALVAVSRAGPVGVDVEFMSPQPDLDGVAESHFAPEELEALRALPPGDRLDAFYRVWTRKEAFIKAVGSGLAYGLERFAVTVATRDARVTRVAEGAASAWTLRSLSAPQGYAAALATPTRGMPVEERDWANGVTPGWRA